MTVSDTATSRREVVVVMLGDFNVRIGRKISNRIIGRHREGWRVIDY